MALLVDAVAGVVLDVDADATATFTESDLFVDDTSSFFTGSGGADKYMYI